MKKLSAKILYLSVMVSALACMGLFADFQESPVYETCSFSAVKQGQAFPKYARVIVLFNCFDFKARIYAEDAVSENLKKSGIDCVSLSRNFLEFPNNEDEDTEETSNKMALAMAQLKPDYFLDIEIQNLYTYEEGGGVLQIDTDSRVFNYETGDTIAAISSSVVSKKNTLASYPETLELACRKIGQAIAAEYLKYVDFEKETRPVITNPNMVRIYRDSDLYSDDYLNTLWNYYLDQNLP